MKYKLFYMKIKPLLIKPEIVIFYISFCFLSIWELAVLKMNIDISQGRLQSWPSDDMMQTVQINSLISAGVKGFWYLHVQPPMFDFARYLLVLPEIFTHQKINGLILDHRIYVFYILIFSMLNVFLYKFAILVGIQKKYAILVTIVWGLYPGNLLCATLLEGTYLSTFLLTLMFYYCFKAFSNKNLGTYCLFLVFVLIVSLTRTVFQIHILIPIILFSFWFVFFNKSVIGKTISLQLLASVLIISLLALPIKQQILFGTTSTTTFAGDQKMGFIWAQYTEKTLQQIVVPPKVVANSHKFVSKFNSPENVIHNYRLEHLFNQVILEQPASVTKGIVKSVWLNFKNASHPTSNYTPNLLLESDPLLGLFNLFFSFPIYITIIILTFWRILRKKTKLNISNVGLLQFSLFYFLPVATIFLANRYTWSEAVRLKTMIEIPIFLVIGKVVQDIFSRDKGSVLPNESKFN